MEEPRKKSRVVSRHTMTVLLLLVVLAVIFLAAAWSPFFRLRQINITGNAYVSTQDICRIAGIYHGENLFSLQTDAIAKKLMKDLRIEQASARRVFPGELDIQITERVPVVTVACEYGYLDLDRQGVVLDAYKTLKQMQIPMLTGLTLQGLYIGDSVQNDTIRQVLYYLDQLDAASQHQLSEVNISQPEHVMAYTTGAVQLRIGRMERLDEKAEITRNFLAELKNAKHPIDYIDFNYTSPFIKFK